MKDNGFRNFLLSGWGRIVMIVVFYLIIFGILVGLTAVDAVEVAGVVAIALAVFGWRALDRITPDMFLFLSCTGWIVYFALKGILSIIIGVFVAPFVIATWITNIIQNNV